MCAIGGCAALFQWVLYPLEKGGIEKSAFFQLYAKVTLHSLTALKMSSKCSFIPYKFRFFIHFRLVMKHNLTFA
uniref:Uncharacterized protein n=1 Tax=Candidatus Kentrum sp. DK TaxID=2126562 RepID=A0A450SKL2_9GAMM|nr:MAG: hypothetical protein BECKDK2373B_GA0170837_10457 [Candidatus Kentron sp. DK]